MPLDWWLAKYKYSILVIVLNSMKHPFYISVALLVGLTVWMAFGPDGSNNAKPSQSLVSSPVTVEVRPSQAEWITSDITAYGDLLPFRESQVLAQTDAQVASILKREGESVREGELLLKLSLEDRGARLKQAEAQALDARNKYLANQKLLDKGLVAQSQLDALNAAYEAAKAQVAVLKQEIERLEVRAPFDGVVSEKRVEIGSYVRKGDPLMEVVDTHAMIAEVSVAQTDFPHLKVGTRAQVTLATGETRSGTVRFIAPKADLNTKTFRVEILLPETDGLPSGVSVTAALPKRRVQAHFVSSALLSLNGKGTKGVKVVNADDKVVFYPVAILQAESSGVYVSGLPEQVRLIVTGQGFVQAGQTVNTASVPESEAVQ